MITVKFRKGFEGIGKMYTSSHKNLGTFQTAITYANRTQALKKASLLGHEYTIYGTHPFYVGKINQ